MAAHINRNLALDKKTDFDRWSNIESLEMAWDQRAEVAAGFVPAGSRVLDIGCGRMALGRYLPNGCSYRPCDLVARDANTIVCDFNAGEFPSAAAADADVIVMLGLLESSPTWKPCSRICGTANATWWSAIASPTSAATSTGPRSAGSIT